MMGRTMITPLFLSVLVSMSATLPPLPLHPHLPKAIVVGGAGGKATVYYFTVPYNPERLKGLQPGFQWHLGRAQLVTEVPLRVGDATVAAGKYKCDVRRGDTGDQWSLVLTAVPKKSDAGEMAKDYVVALQSKKGDAAEHLTLSVINRGYATERVGSDVVAGGVEFALRIDFGDVHEELELAEVFDKDAKK